MLQLQWLLLFILKSARIQQMCNQRCPNYEHHARLKMRSRDFELSCCNRDKNTTFERDASQLEGFTHLRLGGWKRREMKCFCLITQHTAEPGNRNHNLRLWVRHPRHSLRYFREIQLCFFPANDLNSFKPEFVHFVLDFPSSQSLTRSGFSPYLGHSFEKQKHK